jgi:hypothetical protein
MPNCADTTRVSPDERLREIAAILATAVLRLRQRAALPAEKQPENPETCRPDGLAIPRETRLSVRVG